MSSDQKTARRVPEPEILDVVAAPEGECQMWTGDELPERCENDADHLFVYQGSTRANVDVRRNALACNECFKPRPGDAVDRGDGPAPDGGEIEPGWVTITLDEDEIEQVVSDGETVKRDYSEDGYRLFVGASGLDNRELVQTFEETPEAPVELQIHPYLAKSVVNKDHSESYSFRDEGVAFVVAGKRLDDTDAPEEVDS